MKSPKIDVRPVLGQPAAHFAAARRRWHLDSARIAGLLAASVRRVRRRVTKTPQFAAHHLEQIASVNLKLSADGTRWELDSPDHDRELPSSYDDYGDGVVNDACECGDRHECDRLRQLAEEVPIPTLRELSALLRTELGP